MGHTGGLKAEDRLGRVIHARLNLLQKVWDMALTSARRRWMCATSVERRLDDPMLETDWDTRSFLPFDICSDIPARLVVSGDVHKKWGGGGGKPHRATPCRRRQGAGWHSLKTTGWTNRYMIVPGRLLSTECARTMPRDGAEEKIRIRFSPPALDDQKVV